MPIFNDHLAILPKEFGLKWILLESLQTHFLKRRYI